jgi:hypothetical protein
MENQTQKPKKKFYKRWWFWVLVVIVLAVIGSANGYPPSNTNNKVANNQQSRNNQQNQKAPEEQIVKVTALQLVSDYKANQVAADNKYKGKTFQISGTINSIGKDILDNPYVTLNGTDFLSNVQCYFDKSDQGELASLVKDTKLTVNCKVSGESIGNVMAKGCTIVK